jgi:hypothetical protein
MDKRLAIEIEDLKPGAELDDAQLRAVVGAQKPVMLVASTCHISGGVDCD